MEAVKPEILQKVRLVVQCACVHGRAADACVASPSNLLHMLTGQRHGRWRCSLNVCWLKWVQDVDSATPGGQGLLMKKIERDAKLGGSSPP